MRFLVKGAGLTLSIIFFLINCPAHVSAQNETGSLRVQVLDQLGALVLDATVTVIDAGGSEKEAAIGVDKAYAASGLKPGKYAVVIAAKGFRKSREDNVEVSAGRTATLKVTLEIELENQEVSTSAENNGVSTDPENTAGAIILKGTALDALPDDSDELAAALQVLAGPSAGPGGAQFIVDGFTRATVPSKQSIREVRINQNPYSAEYDSMGFGRVEIFTKPGTNKLHGQGFFNFSDESLSTRNPFAPSRAPFQTRFLGANLNGPLTKDRSSFFLDFEHRQFDENAVINATVLDAAFNVQPFRLAVLTPQRRTSFSARSDYQINQNNTLTARYAFTSFNFKNAGVGNFSLLSRAFDTSNTNHTLQLTETAVLGTSAVNVARLQYVHGSRKVDGDNAQPTISVLEAFTGGGSQVGQAFNSEDRLEIQDYIVKTQGKHSLKFGGRLRHVSLKDISPSNFGGTFTFGGGLAPQLDANNQVVLNPATGTPVLIPITSIERYRRTLILMGQNFTPDEIRARGGGATQFSISAGNPEARVNQFDAGLFVQDDWRVRPNLTLSAGLRYETQTNINSNLNFAPRVAFAWSPQLVNGRRAKTVVRGGFGIFYDRVEEFLTLRAQRFNGINQQNLIVTSPNFFPVVPPIAAIVSAQKAQTTRPLAENVQAPYSISYSLGVERQLPHDTTLAVTYIGTRTLHGLRSRNVNAPLPGTYNPDNPASGIRPFGDIGNIFLVESSARLNQKQLIVNFNSSFNRSVTIFATYVLGKVENDALDYSIFPANSYDLSGEYGRSALDLRHRFTLGGTVRTFWGISFNPFIVALSSRPFNITTGRDTNGDALFTERPAFATDLAKPGVIITRFGAFDPNPAPGQAIIPRNFGTAPSYFTVNLRMSKSFSFGTVPGDNGPPPAAVPRGGRAAAAAPGQPQQQRSTGGGNAARTGNPGSKPAEKRYTLTFGLQVQNLFNRANLATPVGNLSSPFFGQSLAINGGLGFGGGGSASTANRRVEAQIRLSF